MSKQPTFADLHVGDILGKDGPDGELFVVYVSDSKVVVQRTLDLMDLTGWEKINLYGKTAKRHES